MKKIMFNDFMGLTQAVLSGRKTMTRRIVPDGTPCGCWSETVKYSRYQVGEVVAIAMSYKDVVDHLAKKLYDVDKWMDDNHITKNMAGWLNKMFVKADLMIFKICITDVKAERLQDISDDDCLREGIKDYSTPTEKRYGYSDFVRETIVTFKTPREAFASLIDKVSGNGTWNSNPWVFAYEFELVTVEDVQL